MKYTVSLKQNHEFRRLYHKGKSAVSPYFAIYCRRTGRPESRLGITTGVKLGHAVKRNCTAPMRVNFPPAMTLSWWPEPGLFSAVMPSWSVVFFS